MFDHISFSVEDFEESTKFYDETLKILGIDRLVTFERKGVQIAGYGINKKPTFLFACIPEAYSDEPIGKARGVHFAFKADSVEQINAWYKKCLEMGGKSNGEPGPRPEYHESYYAAFIIDPNGWRLEAVLHHYQAS